MSRISGLVRERVLGHYFGNLPVADAFRAALRIPNFLNNLFGDGVLSASFITIYSRLRSQDRTDDADQLASAIFTILALLSAALVILGILLTPYLVDVLAFGFDGARRELTIRLVRILFPGTGLLVMSAWCLGILNSHRRFLLSYMAPVIVNLTMIVSMIWFGRRTSLDQLAINTAWASVVGTGLMFLVQLPRARGSMTMFRPALDFASEHVRAVLRNFGPVFLSRGVVQISSTVDSVIASILPVGAVSALGYGQVIALLPISLFSMSVAAAELPGLSEARGNPEEVAAHLRKRLTSGLRRIAFFIIPSAAAFLVLGDVLAAMLYQSGKFHYEDSRLVWSVLAGSAVGLLATSLGRLYSSAFYALLDTRTPLRFAIIRVVLTIVLGYLFARPLPILLGIDPKWGIAGLTASAGIAGWIEFALLRHALRTRIGPTPLPVDYTNQLWAIALVGALVGYICKGFLSIATHPLRSGLALVVYGGIYLSGAYLLRIEEARSIADRFVSRLR